MAGSRPVYILGTGVSHDSSTCLMKDGEILVAIEKERLTRKKHDGGNDSAAIAYCLAAAGIKYSDLSLVVQNANFGTPLPNWLDGPRPLNGEVPVVTISHHLAHAWSAFGTSPFDEAAILVIDGCGSSFDDCNDLSGAKLLERPPEGLAHLWNEKDSFYRAGGTAITPLVKDFSPWGQRNKRLPMHPNTTLHSIGGVYGAASAYAFGGMDDAGKLMGLAPYGRAGRHDFPIFDLKDGRVFVRYDWMDRFTRPARNHDDFKAHFQEHADMAWWVQREVERAILYVLKSRAETFGHKNLCYSGGVALNAVANRRIVTEGPFENVYIQPAAGDNGLALGCAYYGWHETLKRERVKHTGSVFLGKSYQPDPASDLLRKYAELVTITRPVWAIEAAADALAQGKVVGWYRGGAEFGPRALGDRSILADPRLPKVRDFINAKVKFREDFRPFAPSVLAEEAGEYFDLDGASPHMLLVAPVKPAWRARIPAVTHQDGSARIQTVAHDDNPDYRALLEAFKARSGVGVLLNTSMNRRGMPIVETPEDALNFFINSGMDVLILEDLVVTKPADFAARMQKMNQMFAQQSADAAYRRVLLPS